MASRSNRGSTGRSRRRSSPSGGGSPRRSGRNKRARRDTRWRRFVWRLAWALTAVAFVTGFAGGVYLMRLDRIVRLRFEGRLFQVPSRVLAAPMVLYPGLDWKRADLQGTLQRLGYREVKTREALGPGTMRWSPREAEVHLRAFTHPARPEPARRVRLRFAGSLIEDILDETSRRDLVLLEPELVGSYYGLDHEQRDLVRLGDVPPHLIDAILAVEDQRFRSHVGVDLWRILGAAWANLRARSIQQGGSTVTQQLVKNFFLTPERSLKRKAQEAAMALIVEARYDKDAILESYLNEIYLGQRGATAVHGFGEASRLYFGKPVGDVTLGEAALLAAIIQSPNGISPFRQPERALERRDLVLSLMLRQGRIDRDAHATGLAEPLRVARVIHEPRDARYFLDALRRELPVYYDGTTLSSEGLRIYSTLDLRMQRHAATALRDGLEKLEESHPRLKSEDPDRALQGCIVVLRPQTGEVLALVGGRDYGMSQFDRCSQARRPAGSIFKPFVYIAALESGNGRPFITLASTLDDSPLEVDTGSGVWRPTNFDHEFRGRVPVRLALEKSLNVATARLGQKVGIERVRDVARRHGIESNLPLVPSLAIGAADVSPLEVARAYATIANGGIRPEVRTFEDVVDASGRALERQHIEFRRVLDAGTSYLITSLLEGVVDRGTARAVRAAGIRGSVAAKTGTTNDERDTWFVGFTPELVVVVWVGFDEPRSMGMASSRVTVPIFIRFLGDVTGGRIRGVFARPHQVVQIPVEPTTGARALPDCPRQRLEFFLQGTEPTEVCPTWYGDQERGKDRRRRERPSTRRKGLFERFLEDLLGGTL